MIPHNKTQQSYKGSPQGAYSAMEESETPKGLTAASSVTPTGTQNDSPAPASASTAENDPGTQPQSLTDKETEGKEVVAHRGQPEAINEKLDTDVVENEGSKTEHDGKEIGNEKEIAGNGASEETVVEEEAVDESQYPGGLTLGILTFGLMMATFVVALDNTIIATAIPKITTFFDSLDDVGWYGSAYLLTTTSLQPTFGKIYTYYNIKWTYLTALVIFELGSVICAAARSSVMLIVGRAIAGVGAAALFSGGITIIGLSVPLRKRALYIALLSSMFGISSVIGPILGGVLTDKATWRWCFWINLPFGGITLATVFFFFKNPRRKDSGLTNRQKLGEMDIIGAFFLICGITCLLLTLQWGGSTYPWSDSKVWGCLIGFVLIIILFIVLQFKKGDSATIPPRILTQRTIATCVIFTIFLSMGLYSHIYFLPFYFQAVKGTTAEGSGIRTIPYLVSITLSSIAVGGSITAFGWYAPFLWIGSAVYTIGAGLLYTLKVDSSTGRWIGYQLIAGFGAGASIQVPFVAVQVVLPQKDLPSGNALAIFFNTLGGALSVSIAQNIFTNTLVKQIPLQTHGAVNATTIIGAGATHVREVTPPQYLLGVLTAYDVAVTTAFILPIATGGIACLVSFFVEWKSVKGKNLMAGGVA